MSMRYDGLLGFREVAGLRAVDGCLRSGVLYRSGTPQFIETATARRLLADTGIRSTIDLRLPHEVEQEGRGPLDALGVLHLRHPIRLRNLVRAGSAVAPMTGDDPVVETYLRYLNNAGAIVAAVRSLLEPDNLPTLVHCTVGKDRTGVMIALTLSAVGVLREDIVADYASGAGDVVPAMQRLRGMVSYGDDVGVYPPATWELEPDAMHRFLDAMDERYDGAEAYLAERGLTPNDLAKLKSVLLTV